MVVHDFIPFTTYHRSLTSSISIASTYDPTCPEMYTRPTTNSYGVNTLIKHPPRSCVESRNPIPASILFLPPASLRSKNSISFHPLSAKANLRSK